jgi:hypothetical protein
MSCWQELQALEALFRIRTDMFQSTTAVTKIKPLLMWAFPSNPNQPSMDAQLLAACNLVHKALED